MKQKNGKKTTKTEATPFRRPLLRNPDSTGVWCVPGIAAGFETALEPLKTAERRTETLEKGTLSFSAKLWYAANPGSEEI